MIDLEFKTINGWQKFEMLVDTGADLTTLPLNILPILGIDHAKLPSTKTVGVGGITVKTWEFDLPVKLGKNELQITASVVETGDEAMPLLLGRKDFFEKKFSLYLDSRKQVTVISENI